MILAAAKIDYGLIPILEVARLLLGHETKDRSTHNEKHFPGHQGLYVNVQKNRWYSHGNETGGDAVGLIKFVNSCEAKEAFDWLRANGFESYLGEVIWETIVATYDYNDADGTTLLYQTVRYEPKTFRQQRPDGRGSWIWKGPERAVPYRLPELLTSNGPVLIAGVRRTSIICAPLASPPPAIMVAKVNGGRS
jgi:hypothetical protein